LVTDLGNDNITLSAVAVGTDADLELLQFLASTGNGRYHFANTPEEIPQITFEEAQNAGSQSVLRGGFTPVQSQASPILNDIDLSTMPSIQGYNFAEGRAGAQVDLVSDRGDPLLAKWQLGLGRVVSWTADDGSDYAAAWADWDQFDHFWGATLRWTLPDPDNQAVSVAMAHDGGIARLTLETQSISGETIDLTGMRVDVTGPDGITTPINAQAVAPGSYDAIVPTALDGGYRVDLPELGLTLAASLPPSPEWQPSGQGVELLSLLAERTGGTVHSLDVPADDSLFASPVSGANAPGVATPIWMYPLTMALVLFVVEIALRQARMWAQDSTPDKLAT
ncbi:MAG TPA: glutamine amidotransferase, partial [Thermomicrobiales bacterium]|nr:glutamine amidotransferase [Thermomicrobiales bacterium]